MTTSKQVAGQGDAGGGRSVIADIAARAGIAGDPEQGAHADVAGQPDQEAVVTVDDGGVKRSVKMTDLVSAFTAREQSNAAMERVKAQLAELGDLSSVRALQQAIEGLDAGRRKKVFELLAGQDEPDDGDIADAVRSAAGQRQRSGREVEEPELSKHLKLLTDVVSGLAARENGRIAQEKTATLSQQIDAQMQQYPVFSTNAVAAQFARQSVISQLAVRPDATPEQLVRDAAGQLQKMLNERQRDLREQVGVPRTLVRPEDKKGLNAAGLKSGAVRRLAEKLLNQAP